MARTSRFVIRVSEDEKNRLMRAGKKKDEEGEYSKWGRKVLLREADVILGPEVTLSSSHMKSEEPFLMPDNKYSVAIHPEGVPIEESHSVSVTREMTMEETREMYPEETAAPEKPKKTKAVSKPVVEKKVPENPLKIDGIKKASEIPYGEKVNWEFVKIVEDIPVFKVGNGKFKRVGNVIRFGYMDKTHEFIPMEGVLHYEMSIGGKKVYVSGVFVGPEGSVSITDKITKK